MLWSCFGWQVGNKVVDVPPLLEMNIQAVCIKGVLGAVLSSLELIGP